MGRTRAAGLFAILVACGFDTGGVGGSGDLQGSSTGDSDALTTSTTQATASESADTSTTATESTVSATTGTTAADVESSTGPSPTSGGSTGDTDDDPPAFGPFMDPVELTAINTDDSDDDPTITPDLLEMYFASLREGGQGSEDIWRVTRSSLDEDFGNPQVVTALNSPNQDGWPELSHDGLVLTLGSDRASAGAFDIYVSQRDSIADPFPAPVLATDLSTSNNEASAALSSTMLEAFLCSPLSVTSDLHVATRADPTALFAAATPIATVNSISRDCTPFIDESGTRLLFSSDRFGTAGAMDIWTAQRPGEGGTFDDPVNVAELNSIWDDDDPWWAPDGSVVYFSSARGAGGDLDLWVAYAR